MKDSRSHFRRLRLQKPGFGYRLQFKGPVEGFLVNTIRKNAWRVERVMGKKDLYQDGVLIFCLLRRRYQGVVDNPRWFMSLYKTSLHNHIHDVSKVQTKLLQQHSLPDDMLDAEGEDESLFHVDALTLFDRAPTEIREIVRLFMDAPTEFWVVLSKSWNARGHRRNSGRRLIADALGKPKDFDAREVLHKYLSGDEEG